MVSGRSSQTWLSSSATEMAFQQQGTQCTLKCASEDARGFRHPFGVRQEENQLRFAAAGEGLEWSPDPAILKTFSARVRASTGIE